jgi:hypothetical protein
MLPNGERGRVEVGVWRAVEATNGRSVAGIVVEVIEGG